MSVISGLLVVELPDGSSTTVNCPTTFGRGQPPCLADSFLSRQHMLLTPLDGQASLLMLKNQGQNAIVVQQQQQPFIISSSNWKTAAILQPGQQQQVGVGSRFFLPSREATTTLTLRSNSSSSSSGEGTHTEPGQLPSSSCVVAAAAAAAAAAADACQRPDTSPPEQQEILTQLLSPQQQQQQPQQQQQKQQQLSPQKQQQQQQQQHQSQQQQQLSPQQLSPQKQQKHQQGHKGTSTGLSLAPVPATKRRRIVSPEEQQRQQQLLQLQALRQQRQQAWLEQQQQQQQQQPVGGMDPGVQMLLQKEGLDAQEVLQQQQEALALYASKQQQVRQEQQQLLLQQQQQLQQEHSEGEGDVGRMLHWLVLPQLLQQGQHDAALAGGSQGEAEAAAEGDSLLQLMQQQQQQQHGVGQLPSQVTHDFWIHCGRRPGHPDSTARGWPEGKWMLFYSKDLLDEAWLRAQRLFHAGQLKGVDSMKVSTSRPNPNASDASTGVIILYCGAEGDEAGTKAIGRTILAAMEYRGAKGTSASPWISWKSDRQTAAGAYAVRGSKANSMFRVRLEAPRNSTAAAAAPAAAAAAAPAAAAAAPAGAAVAPTAAAVPAAGTDREADRAAAAAARAEAAAAALAAGEHVQCECGLVAVGRVSSTRKNPGRRFYACPKQEERSRCDYLSDGVAYTLGLKNELRGTGVWSFIKASRKPPGAGSPPPKPQTPVPRKPDVAKPPNKR